MNDGPVRRRNTAYDPWADVRDNWPEVSVVIVPMPGMLLGWVRYPLIALREGTSSGQRRCTLAHEIVHLERGTADCGPWAEREERLVHAEVARRMIPLDGLARTICQAGGTHDLPAVAAALDVDVETLSLRLSQLSAAERARVATPGVAELWSVA
jgi:hypothetical protein